MTEKVEPTLQGRHICKAHKADTQKPTLQKSLPCANAQATLCGATQTHIVDDQGERANVQQVVCQIRVDGSYLWHLVIWLRLTYLFVVVISFATLPKILIVYHVDVLASE